MFWKDDMVILMLSVSGGQQTRQWVLSWAALVALRAARIAGSTSVGRLVRPSRARYRLARQPQVPGAGAVVDVLAFSGVVAPCDDRLGVPKLSGGGSCAPVSLCSAGGGGG